MQRGLIWPRMIPGMNINVLPTVKKGSEKEIFKTIMNGNEGSIFCVSY
jgi:hypothetical protein